MFSLVVYFIPHILYLILYRLKLFSPAGMVRGALVVCSVIVIVGFRDGVGYDYHSYVSRIVNGPEFRELGASAVVVLANYYNEERIFFFVMSIVTIIPIYISSNIVNNNFPLFAYLTLPFFFIESFGIVRQSASIGVAFLCYACMTTGRYKYASLLGVASLVFHVSSLPFLMFLLFYKIVGGQRYLIFLSLLTAFLFVLNMEYILHFVEMYVPTLKHYKGGVKYGYTMFLSFFVIYFLLVFKSRVNIVKFCFYMGVIIFYGAITYDVVFSRLAFYFFIPLCFLCDSKKNAVVILVLMLYYASAVYVKMADDGNNMMPYKMSEIL